MLHMIDFKKIFPEVSNFNGLLKCLHAYLMTDANSKQKC